MATAPTQDFIVKSGLNVQGTSTVTSSTGNTGTLQVDGGAAIAQNLVVGTDAIVYGNLTVYGSIPTISITTGTFTNLIVAELSTLNAVTAGVTTATQLDVAARLAVGGLSQLNNATLSNLTNSTSSTTGALQVSGGVGIQKDLWVGGQAYVQGYEVLTTATLIPSTLQAVTEQGSSTNVIISLLNTASSTSTTTGALLVSGGVGIGGDLYANALYINTASYINNSLIITTATVDLYATKTSILAGTDTAVNTSTGIVTIWNTSTLESVTSRGNSTTNEIIISNTTLSTNTVTGALQVAGGVGIGGSVYAGSIYDNDNRVVTSVIPTGSNYIGVTDIVSTGTQTSFTISNLGVQTLTAGTDTAVSSNTGTITVWNTSTLQSVTNRGNTTTNAILINNTTSSVSTNSGALVVSGGVGIGGNLYVGGNLFASGIVGNVTTSTNLANGQAGQSPYQVAPGVTNFYGPGTAGDVLVSNGSSAPSYNNTLTLTSTLSNTTTVAGNALQVVGGVGIGGSLFVDGPAYFLNNVIFAGTSTSIFSTTTVYTDNYLELHFPSGPSGPSGVWTVDDGKDIGHIYHHYKDATGDEHGALIWHNASDELRWYMGGVNLNTATQVWDVSTATFGVFRAGTIQLQNNISATSTTTGTLVVVGGVGVGGGLFVGGIVTSTNVTNAISSLTGALQVTGGVGIQQDVHIGGKLYVPKEIVAGNVTATSITAANLNITGSATIPGGLTATNFTTTEITVVGVATLAAFVAAIGTVTNLSVVALTVTTNTNSTSTTTGAVVVTGGVGIGRDLRVGGTIYGAFSGTVNGSLLGNATSATNLAGGTAGQIPYQSSTNVTSFFGPGTAGNILVSNGTSAPSYNNTLTLAGTATSTGTVTGALQVAGGVGVGGSVYVGNRVGFVGTTGASVVYQFYNTVTNSLDTVFG